MSSLRWRLLGALVLPLLLLNLASGVLAYSLAWLPARLAVDHQLEVLLVDLAQHIRPQAGGWRLDPGAQGIPGLAADPRESVYFGIRTRDGSFIAGTLVPEGKGGEARDSQVNGESVRWLERDMAVAGGSLRVAVARTLRQRGQWQHAVIGALVPLELLFCVIALIITGLAIERGLLPLRRVRAQLHGREAGDFTPLSLERMPRELAPVLDAFNELLDTLARGQADQQAFLSNMAHQLRTPLAGIQLQIEHLSARHADDPESGQALAQMQTACERLIRQSTQLLALARAEPERFDGTRLRVLDLATLVTDSVQVYVEQAARKAIDIGFHLHPGPAMGDAFLLRDLIDNLVDNALRYTPEGGQVTIATGAAADGAWLSVTDNGPGIPPAMRGIVFARHLRLDQSAPGTGLGLAIVRDIARAHGASITLDSGPHGAGTAVRLRFPPLVQSPDVVE